MWLANHDAGTPAASLSSEGHPTHHMVWRDLSSFISRPSDRYTFEQKVASQLTTCIIAGFSLLASLVATYWFAKMRKLFRHRLIMLLIMADVSRSFWIFVFTTSALSGVSVDTPTSMCQATGYLTQVSIEAADLAIFFIAVHAALQVFRPDPFNPDKSGLYHYRKWVYCIWALLPISAVALSFLQPNRIAFNYNGLPICNLPVRPFWYRLALSWIPRYVILLMIVLINIVIYVYALHGSEVSRFYSRRESIDERGSTQLTVLSSASPFQGRRGRHPLATESLDPHDSGLEFLTSSLDPQPTTPTSEKGAHALLPADRLRKFSDGTTLVGERSTRCNSTDVPDSVKLQLSPVQPPSPLQEDRLSVCEKHDEASYPPPRLPLPLGSRRMASKKTLQQRRGSHLAFGVAEHRARREIARRQLRTMFVYPIVYFTMWLIPFINHLLAYDGYLVSHPVYALSFITWICVAGLALVDTCVFSMRETPWRHIPGSDGTFWGSFCFWRHEPGSRRTSQAFGSQSSSRPREQLRQRSSLLTLIKKRPSSTRGTHDTIDPISSPAPAKMHPARAGAYGLDASDLTSPTGTEPRTPGRERYWFERQDSFLVTEKDMEQADSAWHSGP